MEEKQCYYNKPEKHSTSTLEIIFLEENNKSIGGATIHKWIQSDKINDKLSTYLEVKTNLKLSKI